MHYPRRTAEGASGAVTGLGPFRRHSAFRAEVDGRLASPLTFDISRAPWARLTYLYRFVVDHGHTDIYKLCPQALVPFLFRVSRISSTKKAKVRSCQVQAPALPIGSLRSAHPPNVIGCVVCRSTQAPPKPPRPPRSTSVGRFGCSRQDSALFDSTHNSRDRDDSVFHGNNGVITVC